MAEYTSAPQLVAIVSVFAAAYAYYVVQKLRRRTVDLYDFLLLLSLAGLPLLFVAWPGFATWVGRFFGVALPLTVMFGLLFVAVFIILHRSISRIHKLEVRLTQLVQEIGLISGEDPAGGAVPPRPGAKAPGEQRRNEYEKV